jgi:hypothetical protein
MQEGAEHIIPEHESGIQTKTVSEVECATDDEAKQFYEVVKNRLIQVNGWHQVAGALTADFQLTDDRGEPANRTVQKGDHFKIDIPGPGPVTGDGYDWVQVEEVEEINSAEEQAISIRVRPATNPTNERKDVAHFFSEEATSCFMAKREGKKVWAGVFGRNEKPNTNAETVVDKTRNVAVASGAISGFSKLQWKSLVNGLVK